MNRYRIIIPADQQQAANDALAAHFPGKWFFIHGLVPSSRGKGEPPATHYICEWQMSDLEKARAEQALTGAGVSAKWVALDSSVPGRAAEKIGKTLEKESLKDIEL